MDCGLEFFDCGTFEVPTGNVELVIQASSNVNWCTNFMTVQSVWTEDDHSDYEKLEGMDCGGVSHDEYDQIWTFNGPSNSMSIDGTISKGCCFACGNIIANVPAMLFSCDTAVKGAINRHAIAWSIECPYLIVLVV